MDINTKYEKLKQYLSDLKTVAIAFSSGVDSTFLLKTAKDTLGENVIAITVNSCLFPKRELNEAIDFCKQNKIKHYIIEMDETDIEKFKHNPSNRCYICKKELFTKIKQIAEKNGIRNIIEGSNIDDESDYRPGMQAIKELDIKSPLRYANLTKEEIRELSQRLNLKTAQKPSFACLASRFVYGDTITEEKLNMIDKAEQLLLELKFTQVRVRLHGLMARIEVKPEEFERLIQPKIKETIIKNFNEYGFEYVTIDLNGYQTGSMNKTLK